METAPRGEGQILLGGLAEARRMANHADTRTTQLYDRRGDAASLDEYASGLNLAYADQR
jgi:hypothetical protein